MNGDQYQVLTSYGAGTQLHGTYDTWAAAKEARNELFFGDGAMRAAWVMRINPGLNLRPAAYGHCLRRTKHEAKRA